MRAAHDRRNDLVHAHDASEGAMGEKCLANGQQLAMRMWESLEPGLEKAPRTRPYEIVGYVIDGRAELVLEGRTLELCPGDSYVVPAGVEHNWRILEAFTAIEVTSRPPRTANVMPTRFAPRDEDDSALH